MDKVYVLSDGEVLSIDAIQFEGRSWIVPIWLAPLGGSKKRPIRIIAPRFPPGVNVNDPDLLQSFFQGVQLPRALLKQGFLPQELERLVEVRENPDIEFDIPK